MVVTANGVLCVKPSVPFRILVANMDRKVQKLVANQKMAIMVFRPFWAISTAICAADVLDLQDQLVKEKGSLTIKSNFWSKKEKLSVQGLDLSDIPE